MEEDKGKYVNDIEEMEEEIPCGREIVAGLDHG